MLIQMPTLLGEYKMSIPSILKRVKLCCDRVLPEGMEGKMPKPDTVKQDVSSSWKQAPLHEWFEGNHPVLLGTVSRRDETSLARFRSGHTRAQRHVAVLKVYPPSPNCNVT
ncbi:hypothetical protein TNCV_3766181 [Trichonephila clavipes]|nr:hypothetical protein TNCV_3766181 [Trichonephila clavipes]